MTLVTRRTSAWRYGTLGPRRAIEGFWAGGQMGADLAYLLGLAPAGRLVLTDGPRHDWTDLARRDTARGVAPGDEGDHVDGSERICTVSASGASAT